MMGKPKIRFKGYNEDWEQRKFSELVMIERGGSPRPIDKYITKAENGLNWVKIGDAPEQSNYITKTSEKIIPEGLSKTREVHPGDLILSNSMSFGRPYIMAIDGCIHDGWLAIRDTEKRFDLKFLCTLLGTDSMLNQYKAMAAGSTVNNLNKELVGSTIVSFPKMDEQTKIGEYFTNLDHLITLHQHKCDEMKKLKKYMLQKMFPKNGKKVPEIRFDGFTNDWEQRKLGEVVEFFNGDRSSRYPNDSDMVPEGIPFINAGDLVSGRVKLDTANKITEEKYNELSGAKIQRGDIIYCLRGTLGKNAFVDNFDAGTVASSLVDIRPKKIVGKYLFQVLNSDIEYRQRTVNDEGAAQPNLSAKNLSLFDIPMPSEFEQEKIALYFDTLDHLITLHQHKCDELQNFKKYMLQNMFV